MKTKYGKNVVAHYSHKVGDRRLQCVVTRDGRYYNVHIIDPYYKDDEVNTLRLQEPVNVVLHAPTYFDKKYMIARIMEHFIWDTFYDDEGILSLSVTIDEIIKH